MVSSRGKAARLANTLIYAISQSLPILRRRNLTHRVLPMSSFDFIVAWVVVDSEDNL